MGGTDKYGFLRILTECRCGDFLSGAAIDVKFSAGLPAEWAENRPIRTSRTIRTSMTGAVGTATCNAQAQGVSLKRRNAAFLGISNRQNAQPHF